MVNFTTVACRFSSRLKRYNNYKNRLRLAKVILKNKLPRFFWFTVYNSLYYRTSRDDHCQSTWLERHAKIKWQTYIYCTIVSMCKKTIHKQLKTEFFYSAPQCSHCKRCISIRTRKWLTMPSVNGASDWQPALQPVEDILNIHSAHYCICSHTDWHVLNLVNFAEFCVKQINFSCTSNRLPVIVNFRFSQGSVATQLRWGGNCYHSYSDSFLGNL